MSSDQAGSTTADPAAPGPAAAGPGPADGADSSERADLLAMLAKHRHFLRYPARGLTDEQAAARTTVSELCIGGLIKHVAAVERNWSQFIVYGPHGPGGDPGTTGAEPDYAEWAKGFQMAPGETLAGLLADYAEAAAETDALLASLPSLDARQPLPEAPWNPPGETWSARRVFMHVIAETAQHAGHADILREAIDGAKSMG